MSTISNAGSSGSKTSSQTGRVTAQETGEVQGARGAHGNVAPLTADGDPPNPADSNGQGVDPGNPAPAVGVATAAVACPSGVAGEAEGTALMARGGDDGQGRQANVVDETHVPPPADDDED